MTIDRPPATDENPEKPRKGVFLRFLSAAGLVAGGAAGIIVVVAAIAYFTGDSFKNGTNISAKTQQTVSTTLPKGALLPIRISKQLSSNGQDPSVLFPSSCVVTNGVAIAKGTFNPQDTVTGNGQGGLPEGYSRYGDVVLLYVFASPRWGETQIADIGSEHPFVMSFTASASWTVTARLAKGMGAGPPTGCAVAIQSTHAFMGAGNAM